MDIFINFLPLIVLAAGLIILLIVLEVINNKISDIKQETVVSIVVTICILTIAGGKVASSYQNTYYSEKADKKANSYYAEIENLIQNGYIVYINGSAVDFNKVVISDYPVDKIHINDELKEIYISNSN